MEKGKVIDFEKSGRVNAYITTDTYIKTEHTAHVYVLVPKIFESSYEG